MSDERSGRFPRTLIVSHTVAGGSTSLGKTLGTYFSCREQDALAQVYFHSEVPGTPLCSGWFRYTDPDALKSILQRRRRGTVFTAQDAEPERPDTADTGNLGGVYNYGRKRSPLIFMARDGLWRLSGWKHSGMLEWARTFKPEVIFFASGDYAFPYRVVRYLAGQLQIPYVVCCFDDFYLFNKDRESLLGRLRQRRYMRTVRATMDGAARILTVNDAMAEAYGKLFGRKCGILYTAAETGTAPSGAEKQEGISFLGGLGLGRERQLTEIADALGECAGDGIPEAIDVWSGETDPGILGRLQANPRIRFHGSVPADEVAGIIRKSRAVIHTESFDPVIRERVRYSLSTKIPDSIASGTCLLAYGPREAASIDYLIRNDAAFTATSAEELRGTLRRMFTDRDEYARIAGNARALARKNHDPERIREIVRQALSDAAEGKTE